jgi:hypothetical protein
MASLKESAEAWIKAYGSTVATGYTLMEGTSEADTESRIDDFCKRIVEYFHPKTILFGVPGGAAVFNSREEAAVAIKANTKRYVELGLGFCAELKKYEVMGTFDLGGHGACMLDVTWRIKPHKGSGLEDYDIHAVYGYRKLKSGDEGWEHGYIDGEMEELVKRRPDFFVGMGPPS